MFKRSLKDTCRFKSVSQHSLNCIQAIRVRCYPPWPFPQGHPIICLPTYFLLILPSMQHFNSVTTNSKEHLFFQIFSCQNFWSRKCSNSNRKQPVFQPITPPYLQHTTSCNPRDARLWTTWSHHNEVRNHFGSRLFEGTARPFFLLHARAQRAVYPRRKKPRGIVNWRTWYGHGHVISTGREQDGEQSFVHFWMATPTRR